MAVRKPRSPQESGTRELEGRRAVPPASKTQRAKPPHQAKTRTPSPSTRRTQRSRPSRPPHPARQEGSAHLPAQDKMAISRAPRSPTPSPAGIPPSQDTTKTRRTTRTRAQQDKARATRTQRLELMPNSQPKQLEPQPIKTRRCRTANSCQTPDAFNPASTSPARPRSCAQGHTDIGPISLPMNHTARPQAAHQTSLCPIRPAYLRRERTRRTPDGHSHSLASPKHRMASPPETCTTPSERTNHEHLGIDLC